MKTAGILFGMVLIGAQLVFAGGAVRDGQAGLFRVEEMSLQAGPFTIVGDLYIPVKGERHPAVVWVHGSGPLTRQLMAPLLQPQIELFLRAGFAFFLDDIPGAGGSKGEMTQVFADRAMILAKEIDALKRRAGIIPTQIGVAGSSQAGVVMPLATTLTPDIAFMIAEACVAECAYKQDAYLIEQWAICEGRPAEEGRQAARCHRQRYETKDFQEYLAAVDANSKSEICRQLGLNNPAIGREKFLQRDQSPSRLGSWFDPMPLVAKMQFPILALFGEKDKNIDSIQGCEAYRQAFQTARNGINQVEMVANANHLLYEAETGCIRELMAQVANGKPLYGPRVLGLISAWLNRLSAAFAGKG